MHLSHSKIVTLILVFIMIFSSYNSSLLVSSSGLFNNNQIQKLNNSKSLKSDSIKTNSLPPSQILNDTLGLIKHREELNGNWSLVSYTGDYPPLRYNGLSGGLAGYGYNFLKARSSNSSIVTPSIKNELLNYSEQIANELINKATVVDANSVSWPIYDGSSIVDFSYDFGLAGISIFFSNLYNATSNSTYASYATKTLNTIYNHSNHTNGLSFLFDNTIIYNATWYPITDLTYLTGSDGFFLDNGTYNGVSTGSTGLGIAAQTYLEDVNVANQTLANDIINGVMQWLDNQKIVNGNETSYPITSVNSTIFSTSYATGMTGIGDFYLNQYQITNNTLYLNQSLSIFDWLNGTTTGIKKYNAHILINNLIQPNMEFGIFYGIASIYPYLLRLYNLNVTSADLGDVILNGLFNLLNYKYENNNQLQFPESIYGGSQVNLGSTSYYLGTGGIFDLVNTIGKESNNSILLKYATEAKNYLLNQIINEDGYNSIFDTQTLNIENNPLRGMPSDILYLITISDGFITYSKSKIDFSQVKIGNEKSISLQLTNIGDTAGTVSLMIDNSENVWTLNNSQFIIQPYSITTISIIFKPLKEKLYNTILTVNASRLSNMIDISGIGYDNPKIIYVNGPSNNSIIGKTDQINFGLNVTDSSFINKVSLNIVDSHNKSIFTQDLQYQNSSKLYLAAWSANSVANGTYTLSFSASDIINHISVMKLVLKIAIFTPGIQQKLFSDLTRNILIGIIVIMIGAAIFLTRKYRS